MALKLEGERAVDVQLEIEAERNLQQLLHDKDGLLNHVSPQKPFPARNPSRALPQSRSVAGHSLSYSQLHLLRKDLRFVVLVQQYLARIRSDAFYGYST